MVFSMSGSYVEIVNGKNVTESLKNWAFPEKNCTGGLNFFTGKAHYVSYLKFSIRVFHSFQP